MLLEPIQDEEARAIVYRVLNNYDNQVVGTAFLIDCRMLLTCAHVVSYVVKGNFDEYVDIGTEVRVEAPLEGRIIHARVTYFQPRNSVQSDKDIAHLRLPEEESSAIPPARWLTLNRIANDTNIRAFGFQPEFPNGGWPTGAVSGSNLNNWVEITGISLHGVPVRGGMSGSPVWCKDMTGVIGMITEAHSSDVLKVFYLIPFDLINKSCQGGICLKLTLEDDQELVSAFLKLNFDEQTDLITAYQNQPICCFLIHGPDEYYGQRILIRRLFNICGLNSVHPIVVDFGSVPEVSIDSVYSDIERALGPKVERRNIGKFLKQRLIFKDVVICLQTGYFTEKVIKEFTEFWSQLVEEIPGESLYKTNHRLICLIIDNHDYRERWNIKTVNNICPDWTPHIPIELPKLEKFSDKQIRKWIRDDLKQLYRVIQNRLFDVTKEVHQNSKEGIPELVFHTICSIFEINWYEFIEKRLIR